MTDWRYTPRRTDMMVFLKRFEFGLEHGSREDAVKNVLDWINSTVSPDQILAITENMFDDGSYIVTVWFSA